MGFFEKLGEGLRKTRDSIFGSIAGLVNAGEITAELYDDLEEQLILADTGADVAMRLVEELRQAAQGFLCGEGPASYRQEVRGHRILDQIRSPVTRTEAN